MTLSWGGCPVGGVACECADARGKSIDELKLRRWVGKLLELVLNVAPSPGAGLC